jgi:hypothetical protein
MRKLTRAGEPKRNSRVRPNVNAVSTGPRARRARLRLAGRLSAPRRLTYGVPPPSLVTTPFIAGAAAPPVAATPASWAGAAAAGAAPAVAPTSIAIAQGSTGKLLIQQGFGPYRRSVKRLQRHVQAAQPE